MRVAFAWRLFAWRRRIFGCSESKAQCFARRHGRWTFSASMSSIPRRACRLVDVHDGPVDYVTAWRWQHALMRELRQNPSAHDALLLLEHTPVFTLGTASKREHVKFNAPEYRFEDLFSEEATAKSHPKEPLLIRTERGGEVTYHGPGQLVAYPILNLAKHKRDLHWYLRQLEQVIICMLSKHYDLQAGRKAGLTGVWVDDQKVCAIGLKVSKWITMHGVALNIDLDLAPFRQIVPCGIDQYGVTSVKRLMQERSSSDCAGVNMDSARAQFADVFCDHFGPYDIVLDTDINDIASCTPQVGNGCFQSS